MLTTVSLATVAWSFPSPVRFCIHRWIASVTQGYAAGLMGCHLAADVVLVVELHRLVLRGLRKPFPQKDPNQINNTLNHA